MKQIARRRRRCSHSASSRHPRRSSLCAPRGCLRPDRGGAPVSPGSRRRSRRSDRGGRRRLPRFRPMRASSIWARHAVAGPDRSPHASDEHRRALGRRAAEDDAGAGGAARRAQRAASRLLAGFTTCRDMGPTWPYTDIDLRKAIDEGVVPGPRLLASGNYVSPTGGAGDARQFSIFVDVPIVQKPRGRPRRDPQGRADQSETGRRLHQDPRHRRGAVEGCAARSQQYTEEEMHVAVEEAARWGKHVAAHLHGTDGIKAAFAPACTPSITAA